MQGQRICLNWHNATVAREAKPCVLCGKPTILRSPDKGVPCHKTCAEKWLETHRRTV
jgi:hypothetical protein